MNNSLAKKTYSKQIEILFYLILLAFCISLLSNQSFFSNIGPWTDSRVFTTIGKGMANGMVPYRDFFDHKGPLLFFFNFLGYSVSGIHGVWIIEVIAIFVSVLFSYLTIKSLFGRFVALLSVSTGFLLLRRWLEGGNLTEEFAMPLICIALYLFISMLRADSFERWKILLCGLTFGLSLMLRPNMFSVWFVFSVYIVINSLIKKNFSKMMKYIAYFGAGTIVAVVPFLIYLLAEGAFSDYIYQNFIFNSKYAQYGLGVSEFVMHIFDVAFSFSNIVIIGCVACVVGIADNKTEKRKRLIFILLLCSTVVSVMFISFSHSAYIHYYMVLVPLIVVTISILFARFRALVSQNNISKLMSDLIVFAVTLCVISNSSVSMLAQIIKKNAMDDPDSEKQTVEVQTIIDVIENDADEDDTVQVLGNDCLIFLLSDLKPASKFIYDIPVAVMSDEVHQLFAEEWEKSPPSYVVYDKYHYSEDYESDTTHKKWAVAKLESDYEIIHEAENYSVYRRIG